MCSIVLCGVTVRKTVYLAAPTAPVEPQFVGQVARFVGRFLSAGRAGCLSAACSGDVFVTTLGAKRLLRLELNGDRILRVEELFSELNVRLRNIEMGPDGALCVLTDSGDGRLLRIEPAPAE